MRQLARTFHLVIRLFFLFLHPFSAFSEEGGKKQEMKRKQRGGAVLEIRSTRYLFCEKDDFTVSKTLRVRLQYMTITGQDVMV